MFYRKILTELEEWKNNEFRKPLVIRGARQVGKTTVVHEFSKHYKQYIYLNLEKEEYKTLFQTLSDIELLAQRIFFIEGKKWELLSETLLFIDEIQEVPKAINFLRYFYEDLPQLHVITAGSMLETLLGKNISFPVGRVEYKILRPVSFEEFLGAIGETLALEELKKVPLKSYAYDRLLNLFHTYALLGGMPNIIQQYAKQKDITSLKPIYESLLNSYLEDAEKYAKNESQLQVIRTIINESLFLAGKRVTFQSFGNKKFTSKEVSGILESLQKTHLLNLIYPTTFFELPLLRDSKKSPRLQFLDTGLLNFGVGLQKEILGTKDLNSVYQGTMIEHLVGQELIAHKSTPLEKLNFWVRDKNSSDAELDFVYPYEGKVVPIEVKSGSSGRLRSLLNYLDESRLNYAIRFFAGELSLNEIKTQKGKTIHLLNLPYFLAGQTEKYIKWLQQNLPKESSDVVNEPKAEYKKEKKEEKLITNVEELTSRHLKLLKHCQNEPKKGKELLEEALGLHYQSRNKRIFIKPLFDLELIEWTNKSNAKDKQQAYRLTEKGKQFLNKT
ncbi:MAG: DUF4143 domain-containing protein [Flavobacteriales bacterium]|nr:DUF4143 domain-containing protein [Crocinitomicaceae bacterium]NBX80359.1 DUF4143 domain-containing protein [Flavobacteriales bacterium]